MKKEEFCRIESYMISCMKDSAHDVDSVYRVLYLAMEIVESEVFTDGKQINFALETIIQNNSLMLLNLGMISGSFLI